MFGSSLGMLRAGAVASTLAFVGIGTLARADDPPAPPPVEEPAPGWNETSRLRINDVDLLVRRGDDGNVHLRLSRGEEVIEERVLEPQEEPAPDAKRGLSVRTVPVEGDPGRVTLELTVDGRVAWKKEVEMKGGGGDFRFFAPGGEGEPFDLEELRERLRERLGDGFDFDFEMVPMPFGEDGEPFEGLEELRERLRERLRRLRERHGLPPERDEERGERRERSGRWV